MNTPHENRSEPDEGEIVAPPPPPGGYLVHDPKRQQTPGDASEAAAGGVAATSPLQRWLPLGALIVGLVLLTKLTGWWGLAVFGGIVLMVFLHELGHYVAAKRAGMKVTEFFLGFGPRLWSFRRGETEYGVKALWVGAYVKIIGMNNLEEVDPADEARAYRQKPFRDRFAVAVAGSAMHFAQALVLIFLSLAAIGVQGGSLFRNPDHARNWSVGAVSSGSAAAQAGLVRGDRIISVAGEPAGDFEELRTAVAKRPDQVVSVVYEHRGVLHRSTVRLGHQPDNPSLGFLGIGAHLRSERLGVLAAVPQTFRDFGTVAGRSMQGLVRFFSPSGIRDFYHQLTKSPRDTGPTVGTGSSKSSGSTSASGASDNRVLSIYGVFRITTSVAQNEGIAAVLSLFVLINVFIGIFNLVPLLPFDGGHVVVAVYEKYQERRRHQRRYFADVSRLLPVTYAVILVLAGLFVSTLYLDITSPVVLK